MNRGPRSFRYGARVTLTAPLGLVFATVASMMTFLALHSVDYLRIFDIVVASVAALLAVSMLRTVISRVRGTRRIVIGKHDITAPSSSGRERDTTVRFRDIRQLEVTGDPGFARVLHVRHAGGELEISGVMLGSIGELDEIHALLKAARKR